MRKCLALLALLATAWPHVAALECAVRTAPGSVEVEVDRATHVGTEHAGHGAEGGHAQHRTDSGSHADGRTAEHGGDTCTLVMACGVAMLRTADAPSETSAGGPAADAPAARFASPEGTSPATEPPPPRRTA